MEAMLTSLGRCRLEKNDEDGRPLAEAKAGDDTGVVTVLVRDAQMIETCKPGKSIVVLNAQLRMLFGTSRSRGGFGECVRPIETARIRVEVDKSGTLRASEAEHLFSPKEDNDISANSRAGIAILSGGNPIVCANRIHDGKDSGVLVSEKVS